jgi:hypothetical protein
MKKITLPFIFVLLSFSCNEKKNKDIEKQNLKKDNSHITLTLKAVVLEDDEFDLYYSEEILGQYHPDDYLKVKVLGKNEFQEIIFDLPEKIYPIKLRLDVGSKGHDSNIKIDQIILSNGKKSRSINTAEFTSIFKPNKYLAKISGENTYSRKTIDNIYDPFFVSINIDEIVTKLF